MSKKLPTGNFKWVEDISIFTEDYITNYDEESDTSYLLVVDVTYPKNLYESHKYLPFLPEKIKIDKVTKLSCNFNDKNHYPVHIYALKQVLKHGLKLEKVYSAISFSQSAWLKPYIDRNTEFRVKASNDFEKDYYKLLNNSFYGKTMENVRKHRNSNLVNNDNERSKLASEPNYNGTMYIFNNLLIMEMKQREGYMNKPLNLGQAIFDYIKMLMYEFWYDYLQPMYNDKIELCYMDTDSFIVYVETDDFYKDISNDINKWFDTSNYGKDIDRPLKKGINKKVFGKFKDELGGLVMSEFCAHRAKTYVFLIDEFNDIDYEKRGIINKKAKGTKKCVIQNQIIFNDYVNVLFNKTPLIKSQFGFRTRNHEIYTEKINKIALSSNDDKIIQCDDGITTYPYGYFDIKENNTKTELHILREEAQALRYNSKILRKKPNTIQNNSKILREEINDIIKESHAIKENNIKSELHMFREESKVLRNNSKILIEEASTIRNNSKIVREGINNIIKESHAIKENNTKSKLDILREEAKALRNNSIIL